MSVEKVTASDVQHIERLIRNAIHSEIGTIDELPRSVIERILAVYSEFIPVYTEMVRIKDNHPRGWHPDEISIDPDTVEDMLHFFSDYQHITKEFNRLNHQVKTLMMLDRNSERHRYDEWVKKIVHGGQGRSLMDSIVGGQV